MDFIEIIAVIIAVVLLIRIIFSLVDIESCYLITKKLYLNENRKYLYMILFIGGSIILLREINIYQYLIAFITMEVLFFDYYNAGVVPRKLKKHLFQYVSRPKKMILYIVIGIIIALSVIIKFILSISSL